MPIPSTIPSTVKQVILHERPTASIEPTTFKTVQVASSDLISNLKEDQVLVRVDYVSLDPAMRGWLRDARSYLPPVQIGEVMRAMGLGQVVKVGATVTKVKLGDVVQATTGRSTRLRASIATMFILCSQAGPNTSC